MTKYRCSKTTQRRREWVAKTRERVDTMKDRRLGARNGE